jgi:hypothetical protein
MPGPIVPMSRRRFLAAGGAAAAGAVLLGACGGDDEGSGSGGGSTTTTADGGTSQYSLVQFFGGGPQFVAGTTVRAPFGLADKDGLLETKDTPDELVVTVLDKDDKVVADPITVARHADGIPRPYYPLELAIAEPGFYEAKVDYEGVAADLAFQVNTAAEVTLLKPGDAFPALATPTTGDAQGVDPICTADPPCALHEVTAAQALTEGRPMAFLVATPAFCQISVCGPVLDVLVDVATGHPDVRALHAEVYAHPKQDLNTFAPTPLALKMFTEPVLFLVGSDGTVTKRLDTIFDKTELDQALSALT